MSCSEHALTVNVAVVTDGMVALLQHITGKTPKLTASPNFDATRLHHAASVLLTESLTTQLDDVFDAMAYLFQMITDKTSRFRVSWSIEAMTRLPT